MHLLSIERGDIVKKGKSSVKHKPAGGITMPAGRAKNTAP